MIHRTLFSLVLFALSISFAKSQTINWSNTSGGNFSAGANWVGGIAPTGGDDAVIDLIGTYTVTLNSITTIQSFLLNNATTTFNQTAGQFSLTGGFTFTNGIYNLSGGQLTLGGGMTMGGGTMNISNNTTINLTGTMALNGGQVILSNGTISGGSITGGGNRLQIASGTLDNVNVAAGTLDLSINGNSLTLSNGTTFAPGSVYASSGNITFASTQTSLNDVTFNMTVAPSFSGIETPTNATLTLGSNAVIRGSSGSSGFFYLGFNSTNSSLINDGLIENVGIADFRIRPTGTFTNNATVTATGGTLSIIPTGGFTNAATGVLNIDAAMVWGGGPVSNLGTVNLNSAGTLSIQRPVTQTDLGTITRANPNSGTLNVFNSSLTLTANYDLSPIGTILLSGNSGNSSTITSSGATRTISTSNAARVMIASGTLDNVNVAAGTLDLSINGNSLTLSNGTTFAPGSVYASSGNIFLGAGQPTLANVTFNLMVGDSYTRLEGPDNATITLANTATIRTIPGLNNLFLVGRFAINSSIINNGLIENTGIFELRINPSATFTNNGTVRATGGTITINPVGGFVIGASSLLETTGTGAIVIATPNVTSSGTVNATTGSVNIATNTTAAYGVSAVGTTTVSSTAALNVGNSNASVINNAGTFTLAAGGTVNLGPNANPGLFTNTAGIFQVNGTSFTRLTVSGGRITGSGTINALNSTSVMIQSGGTLAPGNSPGQITIGGGLDVGGTLELDISQGGMQGNNSNGSGMNQTPGSGFDTIHVTPPPSNMATPTNSTIRTATTNLKLLTSNRLTPDNTNFPNQPAFASDPFWTSQQKWKIMNTTNGAIELRDANNLLLSNTSVLASVTLFAIDDPGQTSPINFTASYVNSSFSYEILPNGQTSELNLVWNPTPEPTTLLGLMAIGMIGWRMKSKVVWRYSGMKN